MNPEPRNLSDKEIEAKREADLRDLERPTAQTRKAIDDSRNFWKSSGRSENQTRKLPSSPLICWRAPQRVVWRIRSKKACQQAAEVVIKSKEMRAQSAALQAQLKRTISETERFGPGIPASLRKQKKNATS